MVRRSSVFDRLALKETVHINQQMRNLSALNTEFLKVENMRMRLQEMADEPEADTADRTVFSLRATSQLSQQIRDQLDTATNRSEHLNDELRFLRQKIAISDRKREKSASKAKAIRLKDHDDRQLKQEDDDASRRGARQR